MTLDNTQNHEEQTATQVTPQQVAQTAPVASPPSVVEALTYGKRGVVTGFILGAIVAVAVFSLCGHHRDNEHNHSRRHWHRMERFHSTRDTDAMQHMRDMRDMSQMLDSFGSQGVQPPFMLEDQGSGTSYQLEKMQAFEKALSDTGRQAAAAGQAGGAHGPSAAELGNLLGAWMQSQKGQGTPDSPISSGGVGAPSKHHSTQTQTQTQTQNSLEDALSQAAKDAGQ